MDGFAEKAAVASCWARIDAARKVWTTVKPARDQLADALANEFPPVVVGAEDEDAIRDSGYAFHDQVVINHLAKGTAFVRASAHDASPEVRLSGMREAESTIADMNEHLLSRVTESCGLPRASRSAITDMMTRGPWIVWLGIDQGPIDVKRLAGLATDPSDLVAANATGMYVPPPPGIDLLAVNNTALAALADPNNALTLTEVGKQNLRRLALEAAKMHEAEQKNPRPAPYRLWYDATPYGDRCFADPSACDPKDARWQDRVLVMTADEFMACEAFKLSARRKAKMTRLGKEAGAEPVEMYSYGKDAEARENGRFVVHNYWDKVLRQQHFLCEGFEGYLEEDPTYPYGGSDGESIFDGDFYPNEWVIPFPTNRRSDPTALIGIPPLQYAWHPQIENIKFRSAASAASKRSARMYELAPGIDDDTKAAIERGRDGTLVERTEMMERTGTRAIQLVDQAQAPVDYFRCASMAEMDCYNMMMIPPQAMTAQPAADTVGQEDMLMRSAGTIQGDIVGMVETGYAGMVRKSAALIRNFWNSAQAQRFVAPEYVQAGPDGKAPWDQWRAESLDGVSIDVSFAVKGRGDDPTHIKQVMDAVALAMKVLDGAGFPIKDPAPLMDILFKRMGVGRIRKYQATLNELAAQAMEGLLKQQAAAGQGGEDKKAAGGGRTDSRKAGGERGSPDVPGRQSRGRESYRASDESTVRNRTRSATS